MVDYRCRMVDMAAGGVGKDRVRLDRLPDLGN
jgi:hypothetical protein